MIDLISRQDAIDAVICHIWHMPNEAYKLFNCENVVREVVEDAIKRVPSAEAVEGWIPCNERLPEKDELALVTVWNDVVTAWRNRYGGWESAEDMYEKGDVTAWMPLPKPYKGGGEE